MNTAVTTNHGIIANIIQKANDFIAFQLKLVKIFNKLCPDIMFANNRIAKLKTREK
jgi:hypothetical protein